LCIENAKVVHVVGNLLLLECILICVFDYEQRPSLNFTPISFLRKIFRFHGLQAVRIYDFSRETAVRSILQRHIRLTDNDESLEKEELIRGKLLIPSAWIHDAKVSHCSQSL